MTGFSGPTHGFSGPGEVSCDDGLTWAPTEVMGGQAVLTHPSTPGYVSLQASASDTAGNTVTQTVIRAYWID